MGIQSSKVPKLLAGGNPQIAKGDGPDPVRSYIEAMPGWKQPIGATVDALVTKAVPDARRAVRWNSPFWGVDGRGWFASMHCLNRAVKVTFFAGASLEPIPPGSGKDPAVRWIDLWEDDPVDEARLSDWIAQAAALPGWDGFQTA